MPAGSAQPQRDGNPPSPPPCQPLCEPEAKHPPAHPHHSPQPHVPRDTHGRGTKAKLPGRCRAHCVPASLAALLSPPAPRAGSVWHPPCPGPSARQQDPYSPPPPAAAHGARGHGGDSQGKAEHAEQTRLPGEASTRLTYFSFRITCFHFPSPRLGPPTHPQPQRVMPLALGARAAQAQQLPPHQRACELATQPRTWSVAGHQAR